MSLQSERLLGLASGMLSFMLGKGSTRPPHLCDLEGATGGGLCILKSDGEHIVQGFFGTVPDDKVARFWDQCREPAERLVARPYHVSSWQSRDPDLGTWGGAVRGDTQPCIISIHGLPEQWNETLALLYARNQRAISLERADIIAKISGNPHWAFLNPARIGVLTHL